MHYELVAQCNPIEREHMVQEIEMSGGIVKDILEDKDNLLLFIEYDEPVAPSTKPRLFETLNALINRVGGSLAFPHPIA
jgi:hypothetical protein